MKKINIILVLTTLFLATLLSCNENELQQNSVNKDVITSKAENPPIIIYRATWTEWGRASLSCDGWGLCNFEDCFLCCYNALLGMLVDCETGVPLQWGGTIALADGDTEGLLLIKLNSSFGDQSQAISNEETLYIDNDLESDLFILHQGAYPYDESIGNEGGYSVPATKK